MPDRPSGDFLASQGSHLKRYSYSGFVRNAEALGAFQPFLIQRAELVASARSRLQTRLETFHQPIPPAQIIQFRVVPAQRVQRLHPAIRTQPGDHGGAGFRLKNGAADLLLANLAGQRHKTPATPARWIRKGWKAPKASAFLTKPL